MRHPATLSQVVRATPAQKPKRRWGADIAFYVSDTSALQPWMIQLGTNANPSADYCLVYNYESSWTPPTSCPSPGSVPTSDSGNNGNAMGYWYKDNINTSFSHTAAYTYDNVNRLSTAVATGSSTYNLTSATRRMVQTANTAT